MVQQSKPENEASIEVSLSETGKLSAGLQAEVSRALHRAGIPEASWQTWHGALLQSAHPGLAWTQWQLWQESLAEPAEMAHRLTSRPDLLNRLFQLFGSSAFLGQLFRQEMTTLEQWEDFTWFRQIRSPEQYRQLAASSVSPVAPSEFSQALMHFAAREILRIGSADLWGLLDLRTITGQLSALADAVISVVTEKVLSEQPAGDPFAVLALGKLGGQELNYSSDVDLIFVSRDGSLRAQQLARRILSLLSGSVESGFYYRVDVRLRPWGKSGALAPSREAFLHYFAHHARPWEKQAFLKARPVAGDATLAAELLEKIQPLLYQIGLQEVFQQIKSLKQKMEIALRERDELERNVKTGQGSIRDVEFVTQYLQLYHGATMPEVRSRNTLNALARLASSGLIPGEWYRTLEEGYLFLRHVEHLLQLMHNLQRHTMPTDPGELAFLARRMGFQGASASRRFLGRHREHRQAIAEIFRELFHRSNPWIPGAKTARRPAGSRWKQASIARHLRRLEASYREAFPAREIQRHANMAARLQADLPVLIDVKSLPRGRYQLTVVGYDFPGELSLITGLLFSYGFNIHQGQIFTYQEAQDPWVRAGESRLRRIVDVFLVEPLPDIGTPRWDAFREDLLQLVRQARSKELPEAMAWLAEKVARRLGQMEREIRSSSLLTVEMDNSLSSNFTVLRVDGLDMPGLLFQICNTLALLGVNIHRMQVRTLAGAAHDTLLVCDATGGKIADVRRQQEIRAALALTRYLVQWLPRASDPGQVMLHFRDFLSQLFASPDWLETLAGLQSPPFFSRLVQILGVGELLWEDFLRHHWAVLPELPGEQWIQPGSGKKEYRIRIGHCLAGHSNPAEQWVALGRRGREEKFRIELRFLLGKYPRLESYFRDLTHLAEVLLESVYRLAFRECLLQKNLPATSSGKQPASVLVALGKLGGGEIGLGSDLEVMLLFQDDAKAGEEVRSRVASWFQALAQFIQRRWKEHLGNVFELDWRLRPYGRAGSLAVSREQFARYYGAEGPAWPYERQALVRLRPIVGDPRFARQIVALRDALIFVPRPLDLQAFLAMRERQIREHVPGGKIHLKISPGALVDVEYTVQLLQMHYGHHNPRLREANTWRALDRLAREGILSQTQLRQLRTAYRFYRKLIENLRLLQGAHQEPIMPHPGERGYAPLGRRLGYPADTPRLWRHLMNRVEEVRALRDHILSKLAENQRTSLTNR